MKFVQIGAIGHYAYALPTAQKYRMDFCGVCYPDPEDNAVYAARNFEKFGFSPRVYETVGEMLDAEKPDVAVINTVMSENGAYAEMALSKGISVFCEKPVSTTLAGLDRLERVYTEAKKNILLSFSAECLASTICRISKRLTASSKRAVSVRSCSRTRRNSTVWARERNSIPTAKNTEARSRGWRFTASNGSRVLRA